MNVGDLGKLIVAKGFKNYTKSNKSPNLVTLIPNSKINFLYRGFVLDVLKIAASKVYRYLSHSILKKIKLYKFM